jgi:Mrp family chromosome partitioning ATPase/capsular polysaccharide biosynthesis protein
MFLDRPPIISTEMTHENIFFISTIHLFHRYKGVILIFLFTAMAGVSAHHILMPSFQSTATLRVNPSGGTALTGKPNGVMFGNSNAEADYSKYIKLMKSRNFHSYIDEQLAVNSTLLAKVKEIYGDLGTSNMSIYTEMIFDDIDYSGRENDLIDITASKNTETQAVDLANLMVTITQQYLVKNEILEIDDTITYLNDEMRQQQHRIDLLNKDAELIQKNNEEVAGSTQSSTELSLASLKQDLNFSRVKLNENRYLALDILKKIKGSGAQPDIQGEVIDDGGLRGRLIDKLRDLKDEDNAYKAKIKALEEQISSLKGRLDPRLELKANSVQKQLGLEQEIFFSLKKRLFDIELYKVGLESHVRKHSTAVLAIVVRKLSLVKKLFMTLIFSLTAVSMMVLLREQLNPTICHSLHLKNHGIGFLASIPNLSVGKSLWNKLKDPMNAHKSIIIDNFSLKNKKTLSFHFLRLKITHLFKKRPGPLVVSLLSCSPGEGQSVIATNLAACFDFYKSKTILVDCDPDHSGQRNFFEPSDSGGLSEVLAGEVELPFVIKKTQIGNLDFIGAGSMRDFAPGEFDQQISKALDGLKKRYDVIVLNSPNFFVCDNAVILGQKSDMAIVVADAYFTRVSQLNSLVNILHLSEVENIYGIINNADDYFGLNSTSLDSIGIKSHENDSISRGA